MKTLTTIGLFCALALALASRAEAPQQNWTNFVRIGAYGLTSGNSSQIIANARREHVFGIEVDNDIPGRYESFLDPTEKLAAIRSLADAAHSAGNKAFVYIAGTECITASADKSEHSVVKDHPDWLQRKITGEPAVFTSGAAFWIRPGDEDVWISPYASSWRKTYMERVRQIAATGIDGIYVDIPYWMTHFDGWEDTWASFDDATVAAFKEKTGLNAKTDLKLGDFSDPNFRKWIDFRIATLTDFVRDIRDNARSVNPAIAVIPEIYPGIEQESTRVGADVYQMYGVVDAIAHEYEFGSGEHMASSRTQLDWFLYQAGMLTFRAFAEGKATWILNYSWDGDKNVDPRECMKNLAMSEIIAGANFWDAKGHEMADSNDSKTRTEIFSWIASHQETFYHPRLPVHPIGVYFSPSSRDYDPKHFLPSYRGTLLALLQSHREFQVVTPRTLSQFHGEMLVLPNVTTLSDSEKSQILQYAHSSGKLLVQGNDPTGLPASPQVTLLPHDPAAVYFNSLDAAATLDSRPVPSELVAALNTKPEIDLIAPATVVANFAQVDGKTHVFLANFTGLAPGKPVPSPVSNIHLLLPVSMGNSLTFLPFLGEPQVISGTQKGQMIDFALPSLQRGAALWVAAK